MSTLDSLGTNWSPRVLSILRIIAAFLLVAHGTQKLFGFPLAAGAPVIPFELMTLRGASGVLEGVGGALLLLGLFTRPVAFVLSGLMAVAYFYAHAAQNFWPILNRGELSVLYCFVFLYLSVAGGGPWSLDRAMGRDKS